MASDGRKRVRFRHEGNTYEAQAKIVYGAGGREFTMSRIWLPVLKRRPFSLYGEHSSLRLSPMRLPIPPRIHKLDQGS